MSVPRHLLLPKPGFAWEQLDAALHGCGLQRVPSGLHERGQPRRFSDGAQGPSGVEYWEDATLGQRQIHSDGPRAAELQELCRAQGPCWSPAEVLARAAAAQSAVEQVEALAPLAALVESAADHAPQVCALLRTRLAEAEPAVRRAALLVAASLPVGTGVALLQEWVADPQLGAAARRYLAAVTRTRDEDFDVDDPAALQQRAAVAIRENDPVWARRLLDRTLEIAPLTGAAYFLRAQLDTADGRLWPALLDVTTALAVARRQGVHLQAMQELHSSLRTQLLTGATPPTAAVELQAVTQLAQLLRQGRHHEVEEIAQCLLTLPGRAPLWWLTIGLARWERGRPERAVEALEAALAGEPNLSAARFLLGQCRRALGDVEGALQDFARLDPQPGARPAQPSLLTAYADELLGTQAPWEAREHAFDRVLLLRERGRLLEALTVISELLRREPGTADALLAQGILFAELQQPAAALIVLDQALSALRPSERLLADEDPLATVQLQRAAVLSALGDQQGAAIARRTARWLGADAEVPASTHPHESADVDAPSAAAAYAELRRLAQQALLQDDLGAELPDHEIAGTLEPVVARAALREQVAELLITALGALDQHADATACQAMLQRAQRGLQALGRLAPRLVALPSVRQLVAATAGALGITPDPA